VAPLGAVTGTARVRVLVARAGRTKKVEPYFQALFQPF
jgi:hypothetical protein